MSKCQDKRRCAPGNVRVDDEDAVGRLDRRDPFRRRASKARSKVARVVKRQVDGAKGRLEDGDREEVDELGQLGDGCVVAAEVRRDDERRLGAEEGVGDARDGCTALKGQAGLEQGGRGSGTYPSC